MTGGFFAILDDIALLLDDAAVMSKVAAKKTAGILGDDLAVNAEQATGFQASRELPVLWAITKGSFLNKLVILPLAFVLSAFAAWLIVPILLLGGAYLCFEGVEKLHHALLHIRYGAGEHQPVAARTEELDEKTKIRSAVRTDFILSLEIVMIALGVVMEQAMAVQIAVVACVALAATLGVYGCVALIVRMDDMGFFLMAQAARCPAPVVRKVMNQSGLLLVDGLPWIVRLLAIVGTLAMLVVGGGMYTHNLQVLHHLAALLPAVLANLFAGLLVGAMVFLGMQLLKRLRRLPA